MNKEAMNQPECKTCGDTGTKVVHNEFGAVIHQESGACPDCQQPPAGEFTKDIREAYDPEGVPITYENVCTDINDLCTIIDRAEASKADLLTACEAIKLRIHFIGLPSEPMRENEPDWSKEIVLIEAAMAKVQK